MRNFLFIALLIFCIDSNAQLPHPTRDEISVRKLLTRQTEAWNKGDIDEFMTTYWHSDSLIFIGKGGVNYGWTKTLDNYRKKYPDTMAMGRLSFDILRVKRLSPDYFQVIGKWHLKRSIGDLSGHYTLLLRKINGQWLIISDHSS